MYELRINTGMDREVFETYGGRIIYPEKSKTLNVKCPCEFGGPTGTVAFHVVAKVPKQLLASERHVGATAVAWLGLNLPAIFSKANYWDFFRATWLDAADAHEVQAQFAPTGQKFPVQPTQGLIGHAQDWLDRCARGRQQFDAALSRLSELASGESAYGFSISVGEARQLLHTLLKFVQCGADPGGTRPEHISLAIRDWEELARRKNENNFNFQHALHSLRRTLYMTEFPTRWEGECRI
jgi:hypothetical protein